MVLKPHAVFWKLISVCSASANRHKQEPDRLFYQKPTLIDWHVRLYSASLNFCFQPIHTHKNAVQINPTPPRAREYKLLPGRNLKEKICK